MSNDLTIPLDDLVELKIEAIQDFVISLEKQFCDRYYSLEEVREKLHSHSANVQRSLLKRHDKTKKKGVKNVIYQF